MSPTVRRSSSVRRRVFVKGGRFSLRGRPSGVVQRCLASESAVKSLRRSRRGVGAACTLFVLLSATQGCAQDGRLRLDLRGVEGEMRSNVTAALSLARSTDGTLLEESRVRLLTSRAPSEVAVALEPFGRYHTTTTTAIRHDGRRWIATVEVDPGPPVLVASVEVRVEGEGGEEEAFAGVLQRQGLSAGETLSHARYEALKAALQTTAADLGYLDASVDSALVLVDRDARRADVVLHLRTGPRFRFGSVEFQQDVLDSELLHRLVPFQRGAPFDASQLRRLQIAILDGPWFMGAEVVPRRDLAEDLEVPIEVALVPQPAQRYALGVGYGTDTGPRATFSTELRRLNRAGHRADAEVRGSLVERHATARYLLPVRGGPGGLLTLSAGWVDAHPSTSDTETFLVSSNLGRVWGGWQHDVSLTLQRATYEVGVQSGVSTLFVLGTGLSRVRTDDRLYPTRGSLVRIRARASHEEVLSDQSLFDVGAEGRLVRTVAPDLRVITRAEIAHVFTDAFSSLPAPFRYFAGGDRSVRGFGYQALGPVDATGNVVGGETLLVTSVELDRRVLESWAVAAFVDVGNARSSLRDPLAAGIGAGIRWRSPVGMIRVDGAFGVSAPGAPFRLHLNLGPEF
ncbi:MAG TPA: BamA/TamA family outer membrane protein [Longimicrobiales bacterium]|nr:BamA/TamA family outer membrane protein [Longimicrobiales bacterium]